MMSHPSSHSQSTGSPSINAVTPQQQQQQWQQPPLPLHNPQYTMQSQPQLQPQHPQHPSLQPQPGTPMILQYPQQPMLYAYPPNIQQRTPSYQQHMPTQYMPATPQQPQAVYYTQQPYVQYVSNSMYPQPMMYNTPYAQQQQQQYMNNNIQSYRTIIQCGKLNPETNERILTEYCDYFGKEVDIYTAVGDTANRVLYRASTLAEKFNCATNKLGMYLARRRQATDGIYQSSTFRSKPPGKTGLKSGGYFLTLAACKEFENHFVAQTYKRHMHRDWHSDDEHNDNNKKPRSDNLDESIARAVSSEQKQFSDNHTKQEQSSHHSDSSTDSDSNKQSDAVHSTHNAPIKSEQLQPNTQQSSPYQTQAVQTSTSANTQGGTKDVKYAPYNVYAVTNMTNTGVSLQDEFSKHLNTLTERNRSTPSSSTQSSTVTVPKFAMWQKANTFSALTNSDLSNLNSVAHSITTTYKPAHTLNTQEKQEK